MPMTTRRSNEVKVMGSSYRSSIVSPATATATVGGRPRRESRKPPSRYIARPSLQGVGVEDGDTLFEQHSLTAVTPSTEEGKVSRIIEIGQRRPSRRTMIAAASSSIDNTVTTSRTLRSRRMTSSSLTNNANNIVEARSRRLRSAAMSHYQPSSAKSSEIAINTGRKKKRRISGGDKKDPPPRSSKFEPSSITQLRPPRVIIIGAGISGLAAARELSERRHDILVLDARNRIGGRLRTIDLMLDSVDDWKEEESNAAAAAAADGGDGKSSSDLCRVKKWSPVDVGGAFIHGTGLSTKTEGGSERNTTTRLGSHDLGASSSRGSRKSERLHPSTAKKRPRLSDNERHDNNNISSGSVNGIIRKKTPCVTRVRDGIGSLNPMYVLARQKLRLSLHAASSSSNATCLVDHLGRKISDDVDREVSIEFNDVLDLATRCCEQGRYIWKGGMDDSMMDYNAKNTIVDGTDGVSLTTFAVASPPPNASDIGARSPNYVSDDPSNNGDDALIEPMTDFGHIFEECKKHLDDSKKRTSNTKTGKSSDEDDLVRNLLFEWHVANLEMSNGAPLNALGLTWNNDESFAYGGDHSYLKGGMRDVVEALADGFDCRGVGGRRRSGDFASMFSQSSAKSGSYEYDLSGGGVGGSSVSRGVIQCGIEVVGVEIVEREEAKSLRAHKSKEKLPLMVDESSLRRSSREKKVKRITSHLKEKVEDKAQSGTSLPLSRHAYGNEKSTVVRVTTKCGLILEADAVIVTLPLAILSIPQGLPGHITFGPPLPTTKQNALSRLGVGQYNKCLMAFEKPFWNKLPPRQSSTSTPLIGNDAFTQKLDFIGHASSEHGKDILFFSLMNSPILVAIYGGDYAKHVEGMHDDEVVSECMNVLKKVFEMAMEARHDSIKTRRQLDLSLPDWPIDYFVSRWGSDPYSRGAFCYVPTGVNGFDELKAMSLPIYDIRPDWVETDKPKRPLIMFAGEATTPYHPSTIHGAFESGIREAYRLDLALEPTLNRDGIVFDDSCLYQPTFSVRRGQARSVASNALVNDSVYHDTNTNAKSNEWVFDHDASILRAAETFGSSSARTMSIVKEKMLAPLSCVHSVDKMVGRYKSLMQMATATDVKRKQVTPKGNEWDISGQGGTWLIADSSLKSDKARCVEDVSYTRRSSRSSQTFKPS